MCLGYKYGTDCKRVVRMSQHVKSWENYQLCTKCSKDLRTKDYRLVVNMQGHNLK